MAQQSNDVLVRCYLTLRKAVGIIGISLPFVLVIGKWIFESPGIQNSISSYYYTGMRNIFVGSLCAIGVFLFSYRGYKGDGPAGILACIFSIGVALFPATPEMQPSDLAKTVGTFHLIFAACMFLMLAYFSLFLFTKTDPTQTPTPRKLERNIVYRVCGWVILGCILVMFLGGILPKNDAINALHPTFWLESIAIVAFGVSWLVKGEAILGDLPQG
ncbi:DUF998 domain-containing protein [Dehalogenimonas etheniformans]|uniref:DUF998 domain-containing protein n=1 Tax=Dehalogenimonas etheniformans TaxID=1536648 RepID=A0A2P5P6Y4_9CHLR|nr:DUF998 domain-containing protein [Dehalogenimonas etheniformans]PPD58050.1 DUF998 domain-containing protein [Dehalogenimonas etheniformans]QNT75400.1 DUF998 domain-containing protein [Dehalogenimonas etheniformans]